jgi:hypothetical protein
VACWLDSLGQAQSFCERTKRWGPQLHILQSAERIRGVCFHRLVQSGSKTEGTPPTIDAPSWSRRDQSGIGVNPR